MPRVNRAGTSPSKSARRQKQPNDQGAQEIILKSIENMSDLQMRMVKLLETTASTLKQRGASQ